MGKRKKIWVILYLGLPELQPCQGNLIQGELWRPKGTQLSNIKQFVFIVVSSILLNFFSCLPFGLQTGFSSF